MFKKFFKDSGFKKSAAIVLLEIALVAGALYGISAITKAGSLTPSGVPASSMRTLQDISDVLAATSTVNASSSAASSTGNAIQIAECMITKLTGGSCP